MTGFGLWSRFTGLVSHLLLCLFLWWPPLAHDLPPCNQESLWNSVKIVTLAPELRGAMDMIPLLRQRGVVVSIGHSNANINLAEEAVGRGVTLVTHLFNAMTEVSLGRAGVERGERV